MSVALKSFIFVHVNDGLPTMHCTHCVCRYGEDPFALKNLVSALSGMFNTPTQLEEIQVFVSTHPDLGAATRAFHSAMETTRNNIRWMEKNYEILKTWLTNLGFNA